MLLIGFQLWQSSADLPQGRSNGVRMLLLLQSSSLCIHLSSTTSPLLVPGWEENTSGTSCWCRIVNNLSENLYFPRQLFGRVIFIVEVVIPLESLEGKGDFHRWALMLIFAFHGLSTCQITQLKSVSSLLSLFIELTFSPVYFQHALEALKTWIRGTWGISCLDCKLFHGH